MVLCVKGHEKYFHPRVLLLLKINEGTEALNILQGHFQNQLQRLKDSSQSTLLHYAAAYGSEHAVQQLIKFKSDVNAQDLYGRTPLMLAVAGGHEIVVQVLLKARANINLLDSHGMSALHMIFDRQPVCSGTIITLFKHLSLEKILESIAQDELVIKLHEAGYTSKDAILMGNIELLKVLLSSENSIDACDPYTGGTLLHLAIRMKKLDVIKVLIEYGADTQIIDYYGSVPFDYLYGAGIELSDESIKILKILVNGPYWLPWMGVTKLLSFGDKKTIRILYDSNVDFLTTDFGGNTVLHFLAKSDNLEAIKLLKKLNSYLNVRNKDGYTALDFAAIENSVKIVKYLLENGAKVNENRNDFHGTLYITYQKLHMPNERCVELLLRYGGDPQEHDFEMSVNGYNTIFDMTMSYAERDDYDFPELAYVDVLTRVHPAIAHLAVIGESGTRISEIILRKIELIPSWVEYYGKCNRQVDQMVRTVFYNDVTLFAFLTASEKNILPYVRNAVLVYKLKKSIENFEKNSPYPDLLRRRLEDAIESVELRENAVTAFIKIVSTTYNFHYNLVLYIIEYLSVQDMENLYEASCEQM